MAKQGTGLGLHNLPKPRGTSSTPKRKGRGPGSGLGKTAGRGHKGQKARGTVPTNFEGGQMPLHMRIPKLKGFNNPFRVEYQAINLDTIEESGLDEVSPETLRDIGLVGKKKFVKILGRGELTRKVTVKAHGVSKSAEAAITGVGGTVEIVPLPWGDGRPPAKGNAHTNR
jgi:large subunit ribosomal protein L15